MYKAKADSVIKVLIYSTIGIILVSNVSMFFFELNTITIISIISFTLITILIGAGLFNILHNSYYELKEEYLYCKFGLMKEKIYYSKITSIRECRNYFASMALSADRIENIIHVK